MPSHRQNSSVFCCKRSICAQQLAPPVILQCQRVEERSLVSHNTPSTFGRFVQRAPMSHELASFVGGCVGVWKWGGVCLSVVFGVKCSCRFVLRVCLFVAEDVPSHQNAKSRGTGRLFNLALSLQRVDGWGSRWTSKKRQLRHIQTVTVSDVLARTVLRCVSFSGHCRVSCLVSIKCSCRSVSCVCLFRCGVPLAAVIP